MADKKRSSWRVSLKKLPSFRDLAKRLSGERKDDLSNEIVRYRGIHVAILADIRDRLQRGEAAEGVELMVVTSEKAKGRNLQGKKVELAGKTMRVSKTGRSFGRKYVDGDIDHVQGLVRLKASQLRPKLREDWSVEDVCAHFVLPLALPTRCFFLDLLEPKDIGKPFEGAFVSQCRQYRFTDLVDTLLESGEEFVWFDVFCANQPLLTDKNAPPQVRTQYWDVLNKGFHQAIARFDSVLLAFDSWQAPTPLTRAWCVWEMYGAALSGNDLRIVFAGSEAASVEQWLRKYRLGKDDFLGVLANMDPRAMQCHDPKDLEMIRSAVEAMDGGFSRLKQMVTERLTRWLLGAVEDCVKRNAAEGEEDEAFAWLLHVAAMVVNDAGHLDVALSYFRKALAIRKETLGERHLSVADTLNNMAIVYEAQGKLDLALETYEEALAIYKTLGERYFSVANTLNNMGLVYEAQGKLYVALVTYEEALAIKKETLGERHLSVADTLNNMAGVYETQGKLELALTTYEEALAITKETLGPRHSSVAETLNNMAIVYNKQGKLDLALKTYEEALSIYKEALGERHSAFGETLVGIGEVRRLQGKTGQAEADFAKALSILAAVGTHKNEWVALLRMCTAKLYEDKGDVARALETSEEALSIYEETVYATHRDRLECKALVARLRANM